MPELPEVETVRLGLLPSLQGRVIKKSIYSQKKMRLYAPDNLAELLINQRITRIDRRAKYLLFRFDNGHSLLSHLGMSGSYRIYHKENHNDGLEAKHCHLRLWLDNQTRVDYIDPRRFGMFHYFNSQEENTHNLLQNLGIEPFSNEFNAPFLYEKLRGKSGTIKSSLLDQRIIAGLGNIYVCEALWQAGIHPKRVSSHISYLRVEALTIAIKDVLYKALASGGSSLRDHIGVDGELGYFQHSFHAYDQAGKECELLNCKGVIKRIVQNGRSSYYCPQHQR